MSDPVLTPKNVTAVTKLPNGTSYKGTVSLKWVTIRQVHLWENPTTKTKFVSKSIEEGNPAGFIFLLAF